MILSGHLAALPTDLADAVETEYRNLLEHYLKEEWDDAQVDAGRFCEAVLRVIEWHTNTSFTPIDGKSRPDRKSVVNKAAQDTSLPPTLRLQIPQAGRSSHGVASERVGPRRPSRAGSLACARSR